MRINEPSSPAAHELFRALAEPVRLRIAVLLAEGERCVCDLMDVLQLPQSTISRHMSRLKAARLVSDRRDGRWVHYQLAPGTSEFQSGLERLLRLAAQTEPHRTDLERLETYIRNKASRTTC